MTTRFKIYLTSLKNSRTLGWTKIAFVPMRAGSLSKNTLSSSRCTLMFLVEDLALHWHSIPFRSNIKFNYFFHKIETNGATLYGTPSSRLTNTTWSNQKHERDVVIWRNAEPGDPYNDEPHYPALNNPKFPPLRVCLCAKGCCKLLNLLCWTKHVQYHFIRHESI